MVNDSQACCVLAEKGAGPDITIHTVDHTHIINKKQISSSVHSLTYDLCTLKSNYGRL